MAVGMNALMIGDIVGQDAVAYLAGCLPGLRRAYEVYLVIASAENCVVTAPRPWTGFGIAVELVGRLLESGGPRDLGEPRLGRPRGGSRTPASQGAPAPQLLPGSGNGKGRGDPGGR